MKKNCFFLSFFLLALVAVAFSACAADEEEVPSVQTAFSDIVMTAQTADLPTITVGQTEKTWNEFFYENADGFVYVYDDKIFIAEEAPNSFDTVLTVTYKENRNLSSEISIHKQSLQLESLSVRSASLVYPGEWIQYDVSEYPENALHGEYTFSFDNEEYIVQKGEYRFKLADNIPDDKNIVLTVTTDEGISAQKTFYLPTRHDIYNVSQLKSMANAPYDYYVLQNDLDLSGVPWTPFTLFGKLDGNEHTISHLSLTVGNGYTDDDFLSLGLFSDMKGIVKNLNIRDSSIEVKSGYSGQGAINAGILAGYAGHQSVIENVNIYASSLTVHGDSSQIGGIVGDTDGIVGYCAVYGVSVYGCGTVGGIVGGVKEGTVDHCCTYGYGPDKTTVSLYSIGGGTCGGIVGCSNHSTIADCVLRNTDVVLEGTYENMAPIGFIVGTVVGGTLYHIGYEQGNCCYSPSKDDENMKKTDGFMGVGNYDYTKYFFGCGWGYAGKETDNPVVE